MIVIFLHKKLQKLERSILRSSKILIGLLAFGAIYSLTFMLLYCTFLDFKFLNVLFHTTALIIYTIFINKAYVRYQYDKERFAHDTQEREKLIKLIYGEDN